MRNLIRLLMIGTLLLQCTFLQAQEKTVSGTVIDDNDGAPLAGVTVSNQRTKRQTTTNVTGNFSLVASKGDVLVFTYVGYTSKEVTVGDATTISTKLLTSKATLEGVVVTAYGIKREKKSLGYSAPVVDGDDIAQTRRENFFNSLSGRVAGLTVTPTSGTPGASSQIVLRGATSIGGNNQPIIIVDGVPYDNQTLNQEGLISGQSVSFANRNSDYGNRAADINPDDIESVTILKGPEATALYGSDGASGAIVITTKKGRVGAVGLSYDNSFRFEKVYRFPETNKTYTVGRNGVYDPTATANPYAIFGAGGGVVPAFGPKFGEGKQTFDNVGNFFKTGFTQQHNLNIDGGNEFVTYRFGSNFIDQAGIVPNSGFKKIGFKLSGTAKLGKFTLSTFMNYVNSKTDKASKGIGGYVLSLLTWPVDNDIRRYQNPDGTKIPIRNISNYALEFDNPFWDVNKNPAQDKIDRFTGNITLGVDVTKWLNLGTILGVDYYTQNGFLGTNPLSRYGFASNGFYSLYEQTTRNFSNIYRATINKKFGSFSNTLIGGFYFEDNVTKLESQKGERFFERDFYSINNTDPLSRDAKTTFTETRKTRFFGNFITSYKTIIFLSLAGSREGTSTFMSNIVDKDPFFNYGSASLSFVFSDIPGVRNALPWLDLGKLRASTASTGKGPNAAYIIDYRFVPQITTGGGYAYDVTGNNFDLEPERSTSVEFGAEFAAFKNRVKLDVTHYELTSKKQLLAARASYGTGYVIKWFNGGEVENKGWEIQLGLTPFRNKTFTWESVFNFASNKGVVVAMPAGLPTYYESDSWVFGNLRTQYFTGARIGNLAGNSYKKNNAGEILVSPTSGLPVRDDDFKTLGNREPDFTLGWVNNITYKDFSLSFNLDTRRGGDVFNGTEYLLYLTGYSTRTLNREQPIVIKGVLQDGLENSANPTKNTIAVTPNTNSDFYASTGGTLGTTEEDFIERVNWVRLRDVTLLYTFPKSMLRKTKVIRGLSVFFTGTDLFMITNYTGADPSVSATTAGSKGYGAGGIDFGVLSTPRGFNFGCKIQL